MVRWQTKVYDISAMIGFPGKFLHTTTIVGLHPGLVSTSGTYSWCPNQLIGLAQPLLYKMNRLISSFIYRASQAWTDVITGSMNETRMHDHSCDFGAVAQIMKHKVSFQMSYAFLSVWIGLFVLANHGSKQSRTCV